jgi:sugar phosphate isomerase/epimerase
MLKIGCCVNMNASGDPKIGAEAIPLFAELGYDYVELPLAQIMELSEEGFSDLLRGIRAGGIPAEACNNFFPARVRLTGGDAKLDAALEYARGAADRAAAMGVKLIVLGSSGAKNIPPGFSREKAAEQFKEFLFNLQGIVEALGLTVALEPLNTKESNFITTAAEALPLARSLSLDNVKLLVDYYHLRMENEDWAVLRQAGPYLRHIHIASKEGRRFPGPEDGEDYKGFFTILKDLGYSGRVSVEAYSNDAAADGAVALKLLRMLCA